jgi:hypothetical protein
MGAVFFALPDWHTLAFTYTYMVLKIFFIPLRTFLVHSCMYVRITCNLFPLDTFVTSYLASRHQYIWQPPDHTPEEYDVPVMAVPSRPPSLGDILSLPQCHLGPFKSVVIKTQYRPLPPLKAVQKAAS